MLIVVSVFTPCNNLVRKDYEPWNTDADITV